MGKKTKMLSVRLAPEADEQLREMAADDRRSISNMLEVLILEGSERRQAKQSGEEKRRKNA